MSLSNFCCTLLKFYSQSLSGAVCLTSVDRLAAWPLSGELGRCSQVISFPSHLPEHDVHEHLLQQLTSEEDLIGTSGVGGGGLPEAVSLHFMEGLAQRGSGGQTQHLLLGFVCICLLTIFSLYKKGS